MPTYEYGCYDCRKKVSIYQSYEDYGVVPVTCPRCGGKRLKRLISRVRIVRSEEARLDDLSDLDALGDIDENDPRSVARAMRRMSQEFDEELPPEFDEVVDRLESGQSPEEIEQSMPDLGGDLGGDDFDF